MTLGKHPSSEDITAYIDGELAQPQAAAIRRHLDTCPTCAGLAEAQSRTVALLRNTVGAAVDPQPGAVAGILGRLRAERQAGQAAATPSGCRAILSGAKVVLLILCAVLLLYGTQSVLIDIVAKSNARSGFEVLTYVEEHNSLVNYYETISAN